MRKVNLIHIVVDHVKTLRNGRTGKVSVVDVAFFFLLPVVLAFLAYDLDLSFAVEGYNVSVTFFGIFIALLLNIQVAMFAISQRRWEKPEDNKLAILQDKALDERRQLLGELNVNLSYLIFFCCLALICIFIFFARRWVEDAAPALTVFIYSHFMLTLLMVIKRAHALFHKEYSDQTTKEP